MPAASRHQGQSPSVLAVAPKPRMSQHETEQHRLHSSETVSGSPVARSGQQKKGFLQGLSEGNRWLQQQRRSLTPLLLRSVLLLLLVGVVQPQSLRHVALRSAKRPVAAEHVEHYEIPQSPYAAAGLPLPWWPQ